MYVVEFPSKSFCQSDQPRRKPIGKPPVRVFKIKLPFGLYITNSVQEEVGLRGAEMITKTIKPNVAIVTDVCHDSTTPMIDKKIEGETKKEIPAGMLYH